MRTQLLTIKNTISLLLIISAISCLNAFSQVQIPKPKMAFEISMDNPANHKYHVKLSCKGIYEQNLDFKMCSWTPGFYEIVDFAAAVQNFHAVDSNGNEIKWAKTSANNWQVKSNHQSSIIINYDVLATEPFIGNINLDENYGYIIPGGLLMYLDQELKHPVTVKIMPYKGWNQFVATGLDSLKGDRNMFYAANFDELYDSPFLMGKIKSLPSFLLKGKPVQFVDYNLGEFDYQKFMTTLEKITQSGSGIIGDVPYSHYTFLAVGINKGGFGGIEHLNSASLLINTNNLFNDTDRMHSFEAFLAHEYFHLYNVKRIRPIALGPFDYSKENYTNMLWVSEGFTDYYEYLICLRAGLFSRGYVLKAYQDHIIDYENKPGHLYQSATEASHDIWAIGGNPMARGKNELDKTINVYSKGCAVGLMLDLKIRHETHNARSLDDVMRALYKEYYQDKKRGFTDQEFQQECERIAGVQLQELFDYASTVKPVDYPKYFAYAGLSIDTVTRLLPGAYLGAVVGMRDGNLVIREIDPQSPASNTDLQSRDKILLLNGKKVDQASYTAALLEMKDGDKAYLSVQRNDQVLMFTITLGSKREKSFAISQVPNPTKLQTEIYKSWLRTN